MRILIEFAPWQGPTTRARLEYAFRLFCAIQGHTPLLQSESKSSADVCITYRDGARLDQRTVQLQAAYEERPLSTPAPPPETYEQHGENTVLRLARRGAQPDWLAEIFEWVSCADEYGVKRDVIGRVAFGDSYMGRHGLNPRKPYAAIAMRLLQRQLARVLPACHHELLCPMASVRHFVVNTHDIDYLPLSRLGASRRLMKNAAASLLLTRWPLGACKQASAAIRVLLGGRDPLDQLANVAAMENQRGLRATYFFLCDRRHSRDGNYDLHNPVACSWMRSLQHDCDIGLHGSYCSLDRPGQLATESLRFRQQGLNCSGSRQHWLRFTLDRLIPEVECAGMSYDASVGWPDVIGFRAGACFAYPPYNFAEERPARFLEIPLTVMDCAISLVRAKRAGVYDAATDLLSASRRYGWGGISVLWHPTAFGGGQMHPDVGDLFWRLLDEARQQKESWLSGTDFMAAVANRYIAAGLLPAQNCAASSTMAAVGG